MNQEQTNIKTPEFVSIQFQLAGVGSRAAAYLLDTLLLSIASLLILLTLLLILHGGSDFWLLGETFFSGPVAIAIILLFLLNWGYFFLLEFFAGGKTIGKKVVGIRVIQENGHSITLLSSFIRNFLRIIDSLPASYFLGIIMVFFHPKHKRLGDLVAGTIVIHERRAKNHKKQSPLEKEIHRRGLGKDSLAIDQWALKSFGNKEWKLLQTYCNRFLQLKEDVKDKRTKQIADILLPKVGLDVAGKTYEQLENELLVLYLILHDEWEFEL
ncbi:RDD family protein [Bacillus sp. REN16]|uniref:RDD family protein n=1 Tax=Bacillus sp. REN16 TaxID=2887296 RepID=UPI001E2FDDF3|nr:RDD family protein [Bacillus sp. REN16]MCC3357282.1 RDD family protein [Bacillus sp. REN16]